MLNPVSEELDKNMSFCCPTVVVSVSINAALNDVIHPQEEAYGTCANISDH